MVNYQMVGGIGDINSLPSIYPAYAENGEVFNPGRQNPKPIYNGVPLNVMGAMTNPLWALNGFQVQQVFPWELSNFGNALTFFIFGAIALLGFIILLKILPETKGKSLEQIEFDLARDLI